MNALPRHTARRTARSLGWFSIALGLGELLLARPLARGLRMHGQEGLLRFYGLREILTGAGILAAANPAPWVWARVGGDALDLVTLAGAPESARHPGPGVAMGAVAAVTAVDVACAQSLSYYNRRRQPPRDYSDRVGFPQPPERMRGAAREAAHVLGRTAEPLRPAVG